MSAKKGILLVNLGTPDEPTPPAVARYLREFLMDPEVIDIAWPLRWFLVNVLIAPRRSIASAEAYQKVWTKEGSPLKNFSLELARKLQAMLPIESEVRLAMRYQNPTIESVLSDWKERGFEEIRVLPLYPQYSTSATRSSETKVAQVAKNLGISEKIKFVKPFYNDPGFIASFVERIEGVLNSGPWDHLLLSYHGLPERQIHRMHDCSKGSSAAPNFCEDWNHESTTTCYKAHCYETSRLLARALGLKDSQWSVSFQSRLGRAKWIEPYTDVVLPQLAEQGKKHLVVACPAFTCDCLETLEEIAIRGAEQWHECGGTSLRLVPSLNAEPTWVKHLAAIAENTEMFV